MKLRLTTILALLLTSSARAATTYASDGTVADIQSIHNSSAADGDTITVPDGTFVWNTSLTFSKGITLQALGTNCIVRNDVPYPANMINMNPGANKITRITGIEFQSGPTQTFTAPCIFATGTRVDSRRVRVDHCTFTSLKGSAFWNQGALGVFDHNNLTGNVQLSLGFMRQGHWTNATGDGYGDGSYAAPSNFGSEEFMFFEDNTFTNSWSQHLTLIDGDAGCRYVFRHNVVNGFSTENHGMESGGRYRGGRAFEVYSNTFTGNGSGSNVDLQRSGVSVIYGNTVTGYTTGAAFSLENNRNENAYLPFSIGNAERAGADGQNPWDVNVAGGPFFVGGTGGTVTAFTAGSQTSVLTVAGTPYTASALVGYSITRTSGKNATITRDSSNPPIVTAACTAHGFTNGDIVSIRGATQTVYNTMAAVTVTDADHFTYPLDFGAGTPTTPATGTIFVMPGVYFSEITANTNNTITFRSNVQGAAWFLRFGVNDTFTLWKVDQAMDQIGRIGGSLISGDIPSRPGGWNDQTTEACYQWSNTREGGAAINYQAVHKTIRANEHFINNGTTAKPGYTAFQWPHPLAAGTSVPVVPLAPPTSLRIVP